VRTPISKSYKAGGMCTTTSIEEIGTRALLQHAMIQIIIDSHEKVLYDSIVAQSVAQGVAHTIQFGPLELGDIQITLSRGDTVLRELVFERKTLPDLVGSMHDGRYREQKARMLANIAPQNVSYIVEGDSICQSVHRGSKSVSSAYFNMIFRDGVHLFFTRDVPETAFLLLALCAKMEDKPANYSPIESSSTVSAANRDYTSCLKLKSKKNHNITPDNCFILQLAQVPSVSHVIAKNIVTIYPTIGHLVDGMRRCATDKEKHKLLACINKVGKAKASKIIEYMKL